MFAPKLTGSYRVSLQDQLSCIVTATNSLRNAMLPVNRLPAEILTLIFHEISPTIFTHVSARSTHCKHSGALTVITHVCRRWREIALNQSSLWTSIYERIPTYDISDIQQAPLHVCSHFHSKIDFLHKMFTLHGARIQTLSVATVPPVSSPVAWLGDAFNVPAPQLQRLALFDHLERILPPTTNYALFQDVAPELRSLTLSGSAFVRHLPSNQIDNLIHLELSNATQCQWTSADLLALLARCPQLQELIVGDVDAMGHRVDAALHGASFVCLPRLTRIALENLRPAFASALLSYLDLYSDSEHIAVSIKALTEDRLHYSYGMVSDPAVLGALPGSVRFAIGLSILPLWCSLALNVDNTSASFEVERWDYGGMSTLHICPSRSLILHGRRLESLRHFFPELCTLKIVDHWPGIAVDNHDSDVVYPSSRTAYIHTFIRGVESTLTALVLQVGRLDVMQHWLGLISAAPSAIPHLASLTLLIDHPYAEDAVPALVSAVLETLAVHTARTRHGLSWLRVRYNPEFLAETRKELQKLTSAHSLMFECRPLTSFDADFWSGEVYTDSKYWPRERPGNVAPEF